MNKIEYLSAYRTGVFKYYLSAILRRIKKKDTSILTYSKTPFSAAQGNDFIYNLIAKGEPFSVIRFGATEIRMMADVIKAEMIHKEKLSKWTDKRILNTGFFPNEYSEIKKFSDLYLECYKEADILGVWDIFMQDYFANKIAETVEFIPLYSLEPYYFNKPWSRALKNKKVLVIHPFTETIKKQYENREKLFRNPDVLPEFNLMTVTAVQSIGGIHSEYNSWFDALDWMYDEALKIDFDIALIGCGAYGLPLAVRLKKAGKQAVQVGGALQLLFGIKGKRWDKKPEAYSLYNEYWVRPDERERPKTAKDVEGACYW